MTWRANIPICLASWSITVHASMVLAHENSLAQPISPSISAETSVSVKQSFCARRSGREDPADLLERRTKQGLHLTRAQRDSFERYL